MDRLGDQAQLGGACAGGDYRLLQMDATMMASGDARKVMEDMIKAIE